MYNLFNKILLIEYILMVAFASFDKKPIISLYWFGAVILQLGVMLGLK